MYVLTIVGAFMTLELFLCTQCMNLACPMNAVKDEARRDFFRCNPEHARAWQVQVDTEDVTQAGNERAGKGHSHAKRQTK